MPTGGKKRVVQRVVYIPHPDDETLSMGLALVHWLSQGHNVHVVFMNRGGTANVRGYLNGDGVGGCNIHGWDHDPAREGYDPLSTIDVAAARINEGRTAIGLMATIPAKDGNGVAIPKGNLTWAEGNLPDSYGGGVKPPALTGIDAAEQVMRATVEQFPNAFHYTMSDGDGSADHAACGMALRRLKNSLDVVPGDGRTFKTVLTNARFFVSRLYWASANGGSYPADTWNASLNGPPDENGNPTSTLSFYDSIDVGARYSEICGILRNRVIGAYNAWNPAAGSYAIGYHSVHAQFAANFGANITIANIWHL